MISLQNIEFSSEVFKRLVLDLIASQNNNDNESHKRYSVAELSQISNRMKAIGHAWTLRGKRHNLLEMGIELAAQSAWSLSNCIRRKMC